jgi:hypothetical protein
MRTTKSFAAGSVLSLFLAITSLAGEMPGPAGHATAPNNPPKFQPTTCEQVVDNAGQTGSTCEEATPNPFTEAMTIAIQLLTSIY